MELNFLHTIFYPVYLILIILFCKFGKIKQTELLVVFL